MLTVSMLKAMPPCTIFATGELLDVPGGLFMAGTGSMLRWVAVRGSTADWAVYCHHSNKSTGYIARCGDKVHDEQHVKRCVPCDDAVLGRYRY